MRSFLCSLLLAAAACGGSPKPAPVPDHTEPEHTEEAKPHEEEHHLTPEMEKFHDVLAPLWHSEAADRQARTCEVAPDMLYMAGQVQDAPVPEGAADDWAERVRTFMLAVNQMKEDCKREGTDFEANFSAVHDAFHALMEGLPQS
jgi:hypothetical protein